MTVQNAIIQQHHPHYQAYILFCCSSPTRSRTTRRPQPHSFLVQLCVSNSANTHCDRTTSDFVPTRANRLELVNESLFMPSVVVDDNSASDFKDVVVFDLVHHIWYVAEATWSHHIKAFFTKLAQLFDQTNEALHRLESTVSEMLGRVEAVAFSPWLPKPVANEGLQSATTVKPRHDP